MKLFLYKKFELVYNGLKWSKIIFGQIILIWLFLKGLTILFLFLK